MVMTGTVTLPVVGTVKKQTLAIAGVGVAGIGLILYFRSRQQGANTTSSGEAAIDPVTGFSYGSPEDTAALSVSAGTAPTSTGGGSGSDGGSPPADGSGGLPTFASNAQWGQYVEAFLINQEQSDPVAVGNAIGNYLSGTPLTPAQQEIVHRAIAIANTPPVSGPGGAPPSFHVAATAPPTPTPVAAYTYQTHTYNTGRSWVGGRQFITQHSVSGAPLNAIQTALVATVDDPHNQHFRSAFASHNGSFPPNTTVMTHIVVKK